MWYDKENYYGSNSIFMRQWMQIFEVKNNIAKIIYNPAENKLLPSDFLLIEDANQKLIAQVINIETTDT